MGAAFTAALISCGREVTGPSATATRFARGFAVQGLFPTAYQVAGGNTLVPFTRVRIVLLRADGRTAIDTTVDFPSNAESLTLSLSVPLAANAPAGGEPMSATLGYINAQGETVFSGTIPVVVTPSTPGAPAPPAVQVPVQYTGTGSNAARVVVSPKSFSGLAGASFTLSAQVQGSTGQVLAGTPVVFSSSAPGVAQVGSTTGAVTLVGRGQAWVKAQTLTGQADSAQVTVSLPASRLALVSGGSQTGDAGTTLAQPVVAKVTASDGVGVSGVTVTFAAANGGTVAPATAVSGADGTVSTSWKLGAPGGAQAMTITAAGLTGSPVTVSATAREVTPTKLLVSTQPASGMAGSTLAAVSVTAQTSDDRTAAAFTGDVTVSLGANPGGATLSGTTTVRAVNGVATFSDLKLNRIGTGYTLSFASSGLSGATSAAFNVTAGSAARLVFGAMPATVDAGIAIAPALTVTATDADGNVVSTFTGNVTVAIGTNPGGGTLSGTMTRAAVAGVATFGDLAINRRGVGYTLTAVATGMPGATSAGFSVAPTAAVAIVITSGNGQTATVGTKLAIGFLVRDQQGNGIEGVALTFSVTGGGGTVAPTTVTTDAAGSATVDWTLGGTNGAQSFTASAASLPTVTVSATATGGASNLAVSTPPNAVQTAGLALSPAVVVQAQDGTGALKTTFTGTVTATIASGPAGAVLGGTTSVTAVNGVATFSGLRLRKAGTYTLQFAAATYSSGTTPSLTVNAAPASGIVADSGVAQTGTTGTALAQKLVVLVTDSVGNPVSAAPITWAVTAGGGALSGTTTATDAAGRARATFTLGASPGTNTATATSSGLAGSPVTFTASSVGAIATTLVSMHLDTIIAFNATRTLTATSKDAAANVLSGTYTWVSRTPSVATVGSATGVVISAANGSTWVVATESGGTKDSALIVVQQRVATISVTPGTRSIYRTRNYAFTAAAVDGMGNVMPAITAFTWTSLTPSIATVDSTGKVTAVALGSTQVRATNGSITGVATVSVLTPITRIIVGRDSSGVPVTDSTALASLGVGRAFRAEARDTLDAPMTGVTFTWASANPSVALMDSISATRARALSNANGVTSVQASAEGKTGSAALKVQQVLAAIELTPTPDSIGVGGTKQMTARGKDANSRYITGGSFTYASSTPSVATVTSGGLVTGVALGSTNITAASGVITSNTAVISVTSVVPGIISFGRDTLTVGRGSGVSIPILLSRTHASNVVVNLAARDTNAYFAVASVTIPAGQTSANVTLNGRNAGTTQIYATDGGGTGFAGDTAAVAVQANMRLATSSWSVNAGDQVSTQVLLSDPSPSGGTFVTFSFGTAGRAQVSPEPAFIPAGQLASNVVISSLGTTTGSTTITPVATGVNGTASTLYVSAPVLTISSGATGRLGAGQYYDYWYVYTPQYTVNPLPVTFVSSDTNIVTVTGAATISGSSYYAYFKVSGKAPGTARVIASSAGWAPDTLTMTVTSPRTTMCCATTINTTSGVNSVTAYATDSLGTTGYPRTSSLALTVSSSDTTVIKILDKTPTIAAGQYYVSGIRYQPGGSGGTAYIKILAGGHRPDSVLVTVVGPKLEFNWCCTNQLGKGQTDNSLYVYTPNNVTAALPVTLTVSNAAKLTVPTTVTVPVSSYYVYFSVAGVDTATSVSIIASAPGYQSDTAYYRVSSPRVGVCCSTTLNAFGPGTNFNVYARDSAGSSHNRSTPLAVSLVSRNPAVVSIDSSSVSIPAGQYYHNSARLSAVGTGSTYIVASAAGHAPDSALYTVQTPKLSFSFTSTTLGRRQFYGPTSYYVTTPDNRASALSVTITQRNAAIDSLSTTALTIPVNSYYAYFGFAGKTVGTDTIIASASGYLPDTAYIVVSTVKLTHSGLPSTALTTSANGSINAYTTDVNGTTHYVLDTLVLQVTSSDTTVIKPTQKYFRVLPGAYYAQASYAYFGPGSATLTFTDSAGTGYGSVTTAAVTVTGPSLLLNTSSLTYGMRQRSGATDVYVYTQNNVVSATTVNLVSTDTRVVTVPASVTIPAGSYYAYFTVTAQDTVGTIQVQATATGFGPATPITVQVTQPKFVISTNTSTRTTGGAQSLTVYATDANGSSHYTTEAVTVTLATSAGAVASIDSSTVTIAAGAYYSNSARWTPVSVGSAQLSATDPRAALYKYNPSTANVTVTTPVLTFSWTSTSLGLGQYIDQSTGCCHYVTTSDYQASNTTVTLGHIGTARVTAPATVTVPTSSYYTYFRMDAASRGTDTLTASASSPVHAPDTAYVVVDSGRVDALGNWPGAAMVVGDSVLVTLYTRAPDQTVRPVAAATTFSIGTASHLEVRQANAVVSSVTVPANASQVQFYLKAKAAGSGSLAFSSALYRSYTPPSVTVNP